MCVYVYLSGMYACGSVCVSACVCFLCSFGLKTDPTHSKTRHDITFICRNFSAYLPTSSSQEEENSSPTTRYCSTYHDVIPNNVTIIWTCYNWKIPITQLICRTAEVGSIWWFELSASWSCCVWEGHSCSQHSQRDKDHVMLAWKGTNWRHKYALPLHYYTVK